jgi:hypothetical protein
MNNNNSTHSLTLTRSLQRFNCNKKSQKKIGTTNVHLVLPDEDRQTSPIVSIPTCKSKSLQQISFFVVLKK